MVNEELVGGLISALSRGESLQKAMMTFYNAGYKKEEIEESAKVVYTQVGAQTMGVKGSLQDTFNEIASKVGLTKKKPPVTIPSHNASQSTLQKIPQKKIITIDNLDKDKNKIPQNVSSYGQNNYGGSYQNAEQITNKIERAIKDLRQIKFPSKIEIVNRNVDLKPPTVVQKASDYSGGPPKSTSKVITYLLVFILIFLLGALAAVFFFKEELIKLFNNLGLG